MVARVLFPLLVAGGVLCSAAPPRPAFIAVSSSGCVSGGQTPCILVEPHVDAVQQGAPDIGLLNGALPGANEPAAAAIHPAMWRTGFGQMLWAPQLAHIPVEFCLSDGWNFGVGQGKAPWINDSNPDWRLYDWYVTTTAQQIAASPNRPVWWDISNEEGRGTPQLRDALFIRTALLVRKFVSGARFVAMSEPGFSQTNFESFLGAVSAWNRGLRASGQPPLNFGAVSWHEFGTPTQLREHVAAFRQLVSHYNLYGMPPPAVQINEYVPPGDQAYPGRLVAWLSALQAADVQWGAHACWSDDACSHTLDGLVDTASQRPLPPYWVYWTYARMAGHRIATRVLAVPGAIYGLGALAVKDFQTRTVKVMIGQETTASPPSGHVLVHVAHFPYAAAGRTVEVVVEHVSATYPASSVAPPGRSFQVHVAGDGSVTVLLTHYVPGDAYVVALSP